jgi:hypothetical protein
LKDEHEIGFARLEGELVRRMRRPRSGRLPFFGFGFSERIIIVVACAGWKSGKPFFGFPLFQAVHARAVEM